MCALLPVALLPGLVLVRVEATVGATLRVANVSLGTLRLWLVLLGLSTLWARAAGPGEPLTTVEAILRLLNAATALLLTTLADAGANILGVTTIGLVRSFR